MSTDNTSIVPAQQTGELVQAQQHQSTAMMPVNENLPSYMQGVTDMGMGNLDGYFRPPMLALINGLTPKPAIDLGPIGAIYTKPSMQLIWSPKFPAAGKAEDDPPLTVVPTFAYPEYILWNPRGSELPAINARSFDRTSDLAKRAQSRFPEDRLVELPEAEYGKDKNGKPLVAKAQEHLNFVFTILDERVPDFYGIEVLLSFSNTNLKEGRDLASTIKTRGRVPMFGQVYGLMSKDKKNAKGEWKGFTTVPMLIPGTNQCALVSEEWFPWLQSRYNTLLEQYQQGLILADYDEELQSDDGPAQNAAAVQDAAASGKF